MACNGWIWIAITSVGGLPDIVKAGEDYLLLNRATIRN